jgi:hypothetical protein
MENHWKKTKVTATGAVANLGKGNIYGGIVTQVVGTTTTITVYDDVAATAGYLITPVTATATTNVAGAFTSAIGSGVSPLTVAAPLPVSGIELERGLYITIGGTGSPAFWVLYK